MVTALLYGLGTAVPLVAGAAIGLRVRIPTQVLAALMAFGAGTLIAAISEELFGPAFREDDPVLAGGSLLLGAGAYVVADHALERRLPRGAVGWGLLLGAVLDGIPENVALGVSLGGGGLVLLVAIAVGNTPEAIASAAALRDSFGAAKGLALWTLVGAALVLTVVLAHLAAGPIGAHPIAAAKAFAGGATLAVLADTLMPEAYKDGGWWVGMATALGFLAAYALT